MIEHLKHLLIGTDAFRQREKELSILSPNNYLPKKGGLLGIIENRRNRRRATDIQVNSSLQAKKNALDRLPGGEQHPDFEDNI